MAGFAGAVWKMVECGEPILPLAESWNLAKGLGGTARRTSGRRPGRLDRAFCRWDRHPGPSACSRGKKSTPEAEGLGRSRGGFSTKLHVRIEGNGKPMTFVVTPGQQHESTVAEQLVEQGPVRTGKPGHPRRRPKRLVGDKGYSSRKFRTFLRRRGIRITIPHKRNETRTGPFDKAVYRLRNRVERFINRLKQFRRVATRYEKRASNYLAMVTLAAITLWL